MKKFFSEFKTFAMRGNVMDMAIGVVIGAAFGKITTSIVNDIIMPLIGLLTGGIYLEMWNIRLNNAAVVAAPTPSRWALAICLPLSWTSSSWRLPCSCW